MPWLVPRPIAPEGDAFLTRFLGELAERLDDPALDRNDTVRETLAEVMFACSYAELSERSPLAAFGLDPRNALFEAERYAVTDRERFARVKPLLWLWKTLDLTPLGQSVESGLRLRRMLASRVFAHAGMVALCLLARALWGRRRPGCPSGKEAPGAGAPEPRTLESVG